MPIAVTVPARVTGRVSHVFGRLLRTGGLGPRATAVAIAITSRVILANAVAGLLVVTYLTISEDIDQAHGETWAATVAANVVFYLFFFALLSIAAMVRGRAVFAPAWRFLDDARPVSEADQRALLRQPAKMGFFPLRYWTTAAIITVIGRVAFGETAEQVVASGVTVMVGGLVAAATGFLLGERVLRPTFAIALAGKAPPAQPSLGLGTRLVLAWVLGAGLPLALIGATPFLVQSADLGSEWAILTLAVIGLVGGCSIMVFAARSISRPLAGVREALRAVGEGDLAVDVVVDDGGELGRLQAGVNEMVAGLRERVRIEDLFSKHVGTALARLVMADGAELGGQVRTVSALFVDLRGSTELARRRAPQEVVGLLNRFFAAVVAACDAEDGWLDSFEGDGAFCVFGAPNDQPDHADRALRTARALAASLEELRRSEPDLDAGIGVATGEAVAGHVGALTRLEYTVIGDPVNTAARLTVAAKDAPGRVLVAATTVEAASIDEARCWEVEGPVDLKGLAPGLMAWVPRGDPRLS